VSKCLTQLAPSVRPKAEQLVTRLLEILRAGKGGYALMRGTAYGLAGLVKGLGLISLKKNNVFTILGAAVEDKKAQGARQAAVLSVSPIDENR
jgi:tetrahydromethanopterin S-methyltransferase subunit C